jgi:hypothetical protein
LGSYFSPLLNGIQEGRVQDGRTSIIPREAIIYNSVIISRNNTLDQSLPAVFRPFDLGGIITACIRKKQFLFSSSHRFGFSNWLESNTSNRGIYHHSAFSISLAYILLKIK